MPKHVLALYAHKISADYAYRNVEHPVVTYHEVNDKYYVLTNHGSRIECDTAVEAFDEAKRWYGLSRVEAYKELFSALGVSEDNHRDMQHKEWTRLRDNELSKKGTITR